MRVMINQMKRRNMILIRTMIINQIIIVVQVRIIPAKLVLNVMIKNNKKKKIQIRILHLIHLRLVQIKKYQRIMINQIVLTMMMVIAPKIAVTTIAIIIVIVTVVTVSAAATVAYLMIKISPQLSRITLIIYQAIQQIIRFLL